jgi:hypothetical protein
MDAILFAQEMAVNRSAYERLRDEIRRRHAGQYVALAGGKLVAFAPSYDETYAAVTRLCPPPTCFLIFPANEEPDFEPFDDYFVPVRQPANE